MGDCIVLFISYMVISVFTWLMAWLHYSAIISKLQNRLTDLANDLVVKTDQLTAAQQSVSYQDQEIDDLQVELVKLQTSHAKLATQLKEVTSERDDERMALANCQAALKTRNDELTTVRKSLEDLFKTRNELQRALAEKTRLHSEAVRRTTQAEEATRYHQAREAEAQKQLADVKKGAETIRAELSEQMRQVKEQRQASLTAETRLFEVQALLNTTKVEAAQTKTVLTRVQTDFEKAQRTIVSLQEYLETSEQSRVAAETSLTQMTRQLTEVSVTGKKHKTDAETLREQLSQLVKEHEDQLKAKSDTVSDLRKKLAEADKSKTQVTQELEKLRRELTTPEDMLTMCQAVATQMVALPQPQRSEAMAHLKKDYPTQHAMVTCIIKDMMNQSKIDRSLYWSVLDERNKLRAEMQQLRKDYEANVAALKLNKTKYHELQMIAADVCTAFAAMGF